jgi:hypothetical protein
LVGSANGVHQDFEVERNPLNILHPHIVRNRPKGQHQVVVGEFSGSSRCRSTTRQAIVNGQDDPLFFLVNLSYAPAYHLRAVQAGAQRAADMSRFYAAPGNLRQHGREEQCVGVADQSEGHRSVGTKHVLQTHGSGHTCKTTTEDHDMGFFHIGRFWR